VLRGVFEEFAGGKPVTPKFPLIPYADAIRKYGTDKPDLRNPLEMQDVSDHFRGGGFTIFARVLETQPRSAVWAIPAPSGGSRAFCDRMNAWAQSEGQPGLAYIFWRREAVPTEARLDLNDTVNRVARAQAIYELEKRTGLAEDVITRIFRRMWMILDKDEQDAQVPETYIAAAGPVARNLGQERTERIRQELGLKEGDAVFFVAGDPNQFVKFAGPARTKVGEDLNLIAKDQFAFCWIVDFPMYEWSEEEKRVDFSHNPFSMPNLAVEEFLALDPADKDKILGIKAIQYDIVCNGIELSSGAIRNHRPDVMKKAFAIAGYGEDALEQKFGGMLRALSLGAPPHGGIAPGIDRIVMLLCGEENLREVVLFPMNQRAEDLMMGAPSEVSQKQLRELHIRLNLPDNKSG
jgi:aspartyl-tRNA synthetase